MNEKLEQDKRYELSLLQLLGWADSSGREISVEGYNLHDYFDDGVYLGPDQDGVEPIVTGIQEIPHKYCIVGDFHGGKQLEWAGRDGWVETGTLYASREDAQEALEDALATRETDSPMLETAGIQVI